MSTHKPVIISELFGELQIAEGDRKWAVVHTKPRCEKKLADYSKKHGIYYYLPQIESKRVYQRRLVVTTKPMFPSYLFCVLDSVAQQNLLISGMVVSFIKVKLQQELLNDLLNIFHSRLSESEMSSAIWLSEGLQVEIMKGPLQGVRGVVESHEKLHEVRLQVEILRQAVLVKVDPQDVRIIGEYRIEEL